MCPNRSDADPTIIARAELLLSVYQTTEVPSGACMPIESGTPIEVRPGDVIKINGQLVTLRRRINGRMVAQNSYRRSAGRTLRIVGAPLEVVVRPTPPDTPAELCR